MSKLKDSYIDEEPYGLSDYEMSVLDEKYLKEIIGIKFGGKPTRSQISAYFGSFDEYLRALHNISHKRHNEALIVRDLRVDEKKYYCSRQDDTATSELLDLRLNS